MEGRNKASQSGEAVGDGITMVLAVWIVFEVSLKCPNALPREWQLRSRFL